MPPASLMRLRPGHHHAGARAAQVRGDLLDPAVGRVHGKGPRHGEVVVGEVGAPDRDQRQHLLHGEGEAVEVGDLVRRAVHRALGAHAVVAADEDDQGVVELAELLDRLDDAADLVVGVGHVGGPDIDLAEIELLLVGGQRVPLGQDVRPGGQFRVGRNDAELLLVLEDALAHLFPAVVEQLHRADLVHPLLGGMVRRVRGARRVVDEPRPLRVGRGLGVDVLDGVVGHGGDQVPARLAVVGMDRGGVAEQVARLPLAGVAADKAVEVVVALPDRPVGERPGRGGLPDRHVVVLAEPGGGVAVLLQRHRHMRALRPRDGVVAGVADGTFGNVAEADGVMVAAGQQRRPGRRTQRGVVHLGVAQTALGQLVEGRRGNDAAEGRVRTEARIIDQDQQHIRRAFRRRDGRRPSRFAVDQVRHDGAGERARSGSAGRASRGTRASRARRVRPGAAEPWPAGLSAQPQRLMPLMSIELPLSSFHSSPKDQRWVSRAADPQIMMNTCSMHELTAGRFGYCLAAFRAA